jgi:hypothetical protein
VSLQEVAKLQQDIEMMKQEVQKLTLDLAAARTTASSHSDELARAKREASLDTETKLKNLMAQAKVKFEQLTTDKDTLSQEVALLKEQLAACKAQLASADTPVAARDALGTPEPGQVVLPHSTDADAGLATLADAAAVAVSTGADVMDVEAGLLATPDAGVPAPAVAQEEALAGEVASEAPAGGGTKRLRDGNLDALSAAAAESSKRLHAALECTAPPQLDADMSGPSEVTPPAAQEATQQTTQADERLEAEQTQQQAGPSCSGVAEGGEEVEAGAAAGDGEVAAPQPMACEGAPAQEQMEEEEEVEEEEEAAVHETETGMALATFGSHSNWPKCPKSGWFSSLGTRNPLVCHQIEMPIAVDLSLERFIISHAMISGTTGM